MNNPNEKSYFKYIDARGERLKYGNKPEINRDIQEAIYECLWLYATNKEETFPQEVAAEIAFAMRDVLAGSLPSLLTPKKKTPGERRMPPTIESCIRDAVTYAIYCKEKIINNPSYNKTICETYKVKPTTVRTWIIDQRFSDIRAKNIPDEEKQLIKSRMLLSGKNYPLLEGSSSHKAIENRATKK